MTDGPAEDGFAGFAAGFAGGSPQLIARELVAHGPTGEVLTAENQFRARQMCEACASTPHICGKDAA